MGMLDSSMTASLLMELNLPSSGLVVTVHIHLSNLVDMWQSGTLEVRNIFEEYDVSY